MKNALSATKLLERSKQEEGLTNSLIPDWLLRLGGAILLVGGLGYLWYRNSALRQCHQFTEEDFHLLNFRIENKGFVTRYIIARKVFNQITIEEKEKEPRSVLNLDDPQIQQRFITTSKVPFIKILYPKTLQEIKNSKYPKLTEPAFVKKMMNIHAKILKKLDQRIELTPKETQFHNLRQLSSLLPRGLLIEPFMRQKLGTQADGLDHKECLQLLVEYESQTIRNLLDLYKRMVIEGKNQDLQQRIEAYDQLFEGRLRMEELVAYTVEKLGAGYAELPEEEKYHPLILFLSKALTVPPGQEYSPSDMFNFFRFFFYDINALIQAFMKNVSTTYTIEGLTTGPRELRKSVVAETFLKRTGLKLDIYGEAA